VNHEQIVHATGGLDWRMLATPADVQLFEVPLALIQT